MSINKEFVLPIYIKAIIIIIGVIAFLAVMYVARSIVVPIVFAFIIAILLQPVVSLFVRLKINRIVAILITLTLTFITIAAFSVLIISQAARFSESWPTLVDKFTELINQSIANISVYLKINPQNVHDWIAETKVELIDNSSSVIGKTIVSIGEGIVILFLVPVYIFLILFYQPLLRDFIRRVFVNGNQNKVNQIVTQIKTVIQRYLIGLVIEVIIIATLEITALLILGIEYAILLGIVGALLNLIPYIGGIVAVALPMMIALATKSSAWYAVYILIIYYIIQLIDNNYIVPKIVASRVKINALFSIIVVFVGNAIWGIPGMFLSIPLLAIVKLIFDHIESLKPWGFLLGDTMPPILKIKPIRKRSKNESGQ